MKRFSMVMAGVAMQIWLAAYASAAGDESMASQAYLDWHAAVNKATTLTELLPYASAAYAATLKSRGMKNQSVWLEILKEMKEVNVTRATCTGAKCTVEATGTNVRDSAMTGKIMLVRENKLWKLDEEFWTMKLPKGF